MAKFVLIYKGGGVPETPETPEHQQAVLAAWDAWYKDLGAAVVDYGNPFGQSAAVGTDGTVREGAPSGLTGYTILTADNLAAAVAMAKKCPVREGGASVEVYEAFDIM